MIIEITLPRMPNTLITFSSTPYATNSNSSVSSASPPSPVPLTLPLPLASNTGQNGVPSSDVSDQLPLTVPLTVPLFSASDAFIAVAAVAACARYVPVFVRGLRQRRQNASEWYLRKMTETKHFKQEKNVMSNKFVLLGESRSDIGGGNRGSCSLRSPKKNLIK